MNLIWRIRTVSLSGSPPGPRNCVSWESRSDALDYPPWLVRLQLLGKFAHACPRSSHRQQVVHERGTLRRRYAPCGGVGLVTAHLPRSDITLRIVAGESSSPDTRDSARDPTGWPSAMWRSIRVLSSIWERVSRTGMAWVSS